MFYMKVAFFFYLKFLCVPSQEVLHDLTILSAFTLIHRQGMENGCNVVPKFQSFALVAVEVSHRSVGLLTMLSTPLLQPWL